MILENGAVVYAIYNMYGAQIDIGGSHGKSTLP